MDFAVESLALSAAAKDFISGAVAGAFAITVSQPLDTVRVRLQQSHTTSGPRLNTMSVLLAMVRQEGLLSPLKGLTYPLLFASVQSAILFQAYGWTLRQLDQQCPCGSTNHSQPTPSTSPSSTHPSYPPQNPAPRPSSAPVSTLCSPSSPSSPSTHSPPSSPASPSGVHHLHLHTTHHHNPQPQQPGTIHGPGNSRLGQAIAWPWTHSGIELSTSKSTGPPDAPESGSGSKPRSSFGPTALNASLQPSQSSTAVRQESCSVRVVGGGSLAAPHAGQRSGLQSSAGEAVEECSSISSTTMMSSSSSSSSREVAEVGQAKECGGRGSTTGGDAAAGVEAGSSQASCPQPQKPHQQQQQQQQGQSAGQGPPEVAAAGGLTPWHGFIAGGVAGCAQVFLWSPVELLKLRSQLQTAPHGAPGYKNPAALGMQVLRQEGVPGLYRGFTLTAVRDVPSYALYFWLYRDIASALSPGLDPEMAPPATQVLAGGLAGVLAWLPIYPLDVLKTRVQAVSASSSRGKTLAHFAREMYHEAGFRAFYRGMSPTLVRAFLMDGASFLGYTTTLKLLGGSGTAEGSGGSATVKG